MNRALTMRGAIKLLLPALTLLVILLPAAAPAQDRHAEITDFYVYPDESPRFNKLGGFAWPDVEELNALVRVDLGGFRGEEKVDLFMVVIDDESDDEDELIVSKHKLKFFLPAGEHDLVFPRFIRTDGVFGERTFRLKVELGFKGTAPQYSEIGFDITGPEAPDVEILDVELRNPQESYRTSYFGPGDEFEIEALIEIGSNESSVEPQLIVFAMMEDDAFLIDPELNYQPYSAHWDRLTVPWQEGVFEVRARGHLPYFFAEPYNYFHDWRIYVILDFGPGEVTSDYIDGQLQDGNAGEHRATDELSERLIELDRAGSWEVRRLRGGRPDTGRFWED